MKGSQQFQQFSPLLGVDEAARLLGVSKGNIYTLLKSKGFPAFKIGKLWRIPPESLQEWVDSQCRAAEQARRI